MTSFAMIVAHRLLLVVLVLLASACGDGAPALSPGPQPEQPPASDPGEPSCDGEPYTSTFEALQDVVFSRRGCTADACHGSAAAGALDLRSEGLYERLLEHRAVGVDMNLVTPGDRTRSYLWLKLAAKTLPNDGIAIAGTPMPSGLPAISEAELEAMRQWIYAGAPKDATVAGTEDLLDACLPAPRPITIEPLPAPSTEDGLQFVLPPWPLEAGSEHEVCFASYYDFTDRIPEEFLVPGAVPGFLLRGFELRQDPQSHHLILFAPLETFTGEFDVYAPEFGAWTCAGGDRPGAPCDPLDLTGCGEGTCISEVQESFACIGYGPSSSLPAFEIGGAQQAQALSIFAPGVFAELPTRGIVYWNSHAFNLTAQDHVMNGRLNYFYAEDTRYPLEGIDGGRSLFAANAPPYSTQTVCDEVVLPQGARLFELTSHTHQRGKHFYVDLLDGTRIYESFVFNDPVRGRFDPPLAFDEAAEASRTLRFCSLYNNGVADDGSPDPETVTRASRIPESARNTIGGCVPTACVAGQVGAPCSGENDDATCDSSPGAGDGWCDACPITGGESTENEMFLLGGAYYVVP